MATDTMPEVVEIEDQEEVAGETLYEIVDGHFVEIERVGYYPVKLATILGRRLGNHAEAHSLGEVYIEASFKLNDKNRRRPDVSFISYDRWAKGRRPPEGDRWDVLPDLAIEVVSRSDMAWDVMAKVKLYLESGVRAVWLVYPIQEMVILFDSLKSVRVFTREEILEGGEVVPGFQLPLDSFFEDDPEAAPEGA